MAPIRKPDLKTVKNGVSSVQKYQRGVVLFEHLPLSFFEGLLRKYLEQFGNVTRLRLARSQRNAGGKNHFAFAEFEHPVVAQIVADTMHIAGTKAMKSSYIPPEKQLFDFFKCSEKKRKIKPLNILHSRKNKMQQMYRKYAHLATNSNENYPNEQVTDESANDTDEGSTKNKPIRLADLLANTLIDESDDETYIYNSSATHSDSDGTEDISSDEEQENVAPIIKSIKSPIVSGYDKVIKRKTLLGRVQKTRRKMHNIRSVTRHTQRKFLSALELIKNGEELKKGKAIIKLQQKKAQ